MLFFVVIAIVIVIFVVAVPHHTPYSNSFLFIFPTHRLSALMSSLASVFNSSSTLLTMDIWLKIRPKSTGQQLVVIGRCATALMCVVSLLWLPLVGRGAQLFVYVQRVSTYLSPPITSIFLLSLWSETVEPAAAAGLFLGLFLGAGMHPLKRDRWC